MIEELQEQLIGVTLVEAADVPGADKSIVLVRNDNLSEARDAARWLGVVGPWLPLAVVVLAGLGIWAAPSRRVALMAGGIGVAIMMCGLLVGLAVMRQIFLDAVTPVAQSQDASAAVYDTLVRFLRQAILTALHGLAHRDRRVFLRTRPRCRRCTLSRGPKYGICRARARPDRADDRCRRTVAAHEPTPDHRRRHRRRGLTLFLWNYPTPASVALLLLLVVVVLVILNVLAAADGSEQHSQR